MTLLWLTENLAIVFSIFLSIITFWSQLKTPAPYGRHDPKDNRWGPPVNQRISHVLNDGLWGVGFFIFILYMNNFGNAGKINYVFTSAWLIHFFYRGFIHPFYMRYSSEQVALGIPVTGLTLAYFAYIQASYLATEVYEDEYIYDRKFVIGSLIFIVGFCINKWADYILRNLRKKSTQTKYVVPKIGLFKVISCPNYFGEMIQWFGWALATWSLHGFLYFCFASATFIPRARHNHQWCCEKLKNYPCDRKNLIPYLY